MSHIPTELIRFLKGYLPGRTQFLRQVPGEIGDRNEATDDADEKTF
jgi:hypothetical protein